MSTYNLHIRASDHATEEIIFKGSASQRKPVAASEKGEWHIQHNSGLDSIEAVKEKISVRICAAETNQNKHRDVIRTAAGESEFYVYYIKSSRGENVRIHDPLFSIRASNLLYVVDIILKVALKLLVGAMAGYLYWQKRRMELKEENEILRKESERLKLNRN